MITPQNLGANMQDSLTTLQKARVFAKYGYVAEPCWEVLQLFTDEGFVELKRELASLSRTDQMKRIDTVARSVFERTLANLPSDIVIPMSGGRDSRFILCMVQELGLIGHARAITWGPSSGLDWQIAERLAAQFSVSHERLHTTEAKLTAHDLRLAFDTGAYWTDLMFAHFNQAWSRLASPSAHAVIGYLGGPPVGCHYRLGDEHLDFPAAIQAFDHWNSPAPQGGPMIGAVEHRLISGELVSLPEQLDLVFRQEGYLRRVVAPPKLNLSTPFADPDWLRLMYALPPASRADSNLYSAYLQTRFSKAFQIGTSGAHGLHADTPRWRRRVQRQVRRLWNVASNVGRTRDFRTSDKYGDPRDLLASLHASPDDPRALRRLLQQPPPRSREEAHARRMRLMLLCNLSFDRIALPEDDEKRAA